MALKDTFKHAMEATKEFGEQTIGSAVGGLRLGGIILGSITVAAPLGYAFQAVASVRGKQYQNYFADQMARTDGMHFISTLAGPSSDEYKRGQFTSPFTGKVTTERPSKMAGNIADNRVGPDADGIPTFTRLTNLASAGTTGIGSVAAATTLAFPVILGGLAASGTSMLLTDKQKYAALPDAKTASDAVYLPQPQLVP